MVGYDELIEEHGPAILRYLADAEWRAGIEKAMAAGHRPQTILEYCRLRGPERMIEYRAVLVFLQCKGLVPRDR